MITMFMDHGINMVFQLMPWYYHGDDTMMMMIIRGYYGSFGTELNVLWYFHGKVLLIIIPWYYRGTCLNSMVIPWYFLVLRLF